MKIFIFSFINLCLVLQGCTLSENTNIPPLVRAPNQMDLDATSAELESKVATLGILTGNNSAEPLAEVIAAGKRNLQWIQILSKNRRPGTPPLSLSKKAVAKDTISNPTKYNAKIVVADYEALKIEMPGVMNSVLSGQREFTKQVPIELETFLDLAGKLDKLYQTALRWKLYEPSLPQMSFQRRWDIRGYYFLSRRTNLEQELGSWESLTSENKTKLHEWLMIECYNTTGDDDKCETEFSEALTENMIWDFHQKYVEISKYMYEQYFTIQNTRSEFIWNFKNPLKMIVPFKTPADLKLKEALRVNIQDEWRWQDWKLELKFSPTALVRVNFQEGAVPHVNGEGGDTITMDASSPLTEETVKYALRHEFGHVLGFPDCYMEFYDEKEEVMKSYQIDPTDIMCARSGVFKERHFLELKRVYFQDQP